MKKEKVKERISLHSGDYINILKNVPENRFRYIIPKYIHPKNSDKILDVGCGYALLSKIFKKYKANYFGVDFSKDFIREAHKFVDEHKIKNTYLYCDDVNIFSKKIGKEFDLITMLDFSEHVEDIDLIKILNSLHHVMKKNSDLFIYTPNLDFFWERMKDCGIAKQSDQHIAVRNTKMYSLLFNETKFSSCNIRFYYPSHFNVFRFCHFLSYVPFVNKYFKAKILIQITKN